MRDKTGLTTSSRVVGVAMPLRICLAGSGSIEVLARAVIEVIETSDYNVAHVCMAGLSEGVASVNVTLYSSMGRYATVCMSDSLKTTSTQ